MKSKPNEHQLEFQFADSEPIFEKRSKRAAQKFACETCGKMFRVELPVREKGKGRFCSKRCYGQDRTRKREMSACEGCGTMVYTPPHLRRLGKGRFCSKDCYAVSLRGQGRPRIGQESACESCGKMVYASPSDRKIGRGRFCSRGCFNLSRRGREKPQSKGRYLTAHGTIVVKTGCQQRKYEHRAVMESALGRELTSNELVIHLNGNKQDNRLENLQVLTPTEHRKLYKRPVKRVTLLCHGCGIEYRKRPCEASARFCSKECALRYVVEQKRRKAAELRILRGGKQKMTAGYIRVYCPTHPNADPNGYIAEHRLVAEHKYQRPILPSEHVHHINGVKDDNRPENLEVLNASDHVRLTIKEAAAKRHKNKAELEAYRRKFGPLEE